MPEPGVTNVQWDRIRCMVSPEAPVCAKLKAPELPSTPSLPPDSVRLPRTDRPWVCRDPELAKKLQPTIHQVVEQELAWFKSDIPADPQRLKGRLLAFVVRLQKAFGATDVCTGAFRFSEEELLAVGRRASQQMAYSSGVDRDLYERININAYAAASRRRQGK